MQGIESLVRAIEELGRKVERLESSLNPEVLQEEESEKSILVFAEGEFSLEDDLDRLEERRTSLRFLRTYQGSSVDAI